MRVIVHSVRTLVLTFLCLASVTTSFSQSITTGNGRYEIGLGLGPMFFLGDLGGNQGQGTTLIKDVNLPLTTLSKGLFLNVYPGEWFGLRLAVNHGYLMGDDSKIISKGGDEQYRKDRNLKFKSSVFEGYAAAEIYPTVFMEKYDGLQGKFRPYGVLGVGLFKYKPQGEYFDPSGRSYWVDLQPLRLEGQGMAEYPDRQPYKLMNVEIPMGFGFKYYLKENVYLGMEVMHRKTFTDYIDDVSTNYIDKDLFPNYLAPELVAIAQQMHYRQNFDPQYGQNTRQPGINEQRGDPTENDSFFSTIMRFGWRLNDANSPSGRASRQMRCPAFY
ncbi:MAG: hypothetical protein ACR2KB_10135 [Chitinophagaceae bacterium]